MVGAPGDFRIQQPLDPKSSLRSNPGSRDCRVTSQKPRTS